MEVARLRFTADGLDPLAAVSFYTAADEVDYAVRIYDEFLSGQLSDPLATVAGTAAVSGYHTVDLDTLVTLSAGDDFYVNLEVSDGGLAFDSTSEIPVLLGAPAVTDGSVVSDAGAGESYYLDGGIWYDLESRYLYDSELGREVTGSANFCIKAFTAVPEPSTLAGLLLLCCLGLATRSRHRALQ